MKNKVIKIVLLISIYIAISLAIYFVLKACGFTSVDKIRRFVKSAGAMGYVVFCLLQLVLSTIICVVPFEDELLTVCAIILFGPIKGFFVAAINMFITSSLQFVIGRYFCKSVVAKLIGGDSVVKYENYLKVKGEIMLPILYLIPLFPHDSLCLLSGMSKMSYWYFAPITLIMRSIEIAEVCFLSSGMIKFSALSVMDWIIIVNLLIIDIYLILKLKKLLDNKINKNK